MTQIFKRKIKNYFPLLLKEIFKIHHNDQELTPFTSEQNFQDPLHGFFTDMVLPPPLPIPNPLAKGSNSTQILPPGPSGSPLSSQILRVSSSVRLKMRRQKPIF